MRRQPNLDTVTGRTHLLKNFHLAAGKLRTLVNRIDLVPDGAELVIMLKAIWP